MSRAAERRGVGRRALIAAAGVVLVGGWFAARAVVGRTEFRVESVDDPGLGDGDDRFLRVRADAPGRALEARYSWARGGGELRPWPFGGLRVLDLASSPVPAGDAVGLGVVRLEPSALAGHTLDVGFGFSGDRVFRTALGLSESEGWEHTEGALVQWRVYQDVEVRGGDAELQLGPLRLTSGVTGTLWEWRLLGDPLVMGEHLGGARRRSVWRGIGPGIAHVEEQLEVDREPVTLRLELHPVEPGGPAGRAGIEGASGAGPGTGR